ncbi:hypothetical protein KCP77_13895 [Salmonella enterica subsp. enterica]|nr:hypothetical protein KCP77_13895 [Salmonella enterica subsp. enterica]
MVGESGSGKSLIAKRYLRRREKTAARVLPTVCVLMISICCASPRERRKLVGHNVSMIFGQSLP